MSIDVTVVRYGGDYPGEDIIDPYIGSEQAAIQRGRNELDENSSGLQPVDLTIPYTSGIVPGKYIKVHDYELSEVWVGKCVSVRIQKDGPAILMQIRVKRPTDFHVRA